MKGECKLLSSEHMEVDQINMNGCNTIGNGNMTAKPSDSDYDKQDNLLIITDNSSGIENNETKFCQVSNQMDNKSTGDNTENGGVNKDVIEKTESVNQSIKPTDVQSTLNTKPENGSINQIIKPDDKFVDIIVANENGEDAIEADKHKILVKTEIEEGTIAENSSNGQFDELEVMDVTDNSLVEQRIECEEKMDTDNRFEEDAVTEGTDAVTEGTDAVTESTDAVTEGTDAVTKGTDAELVVVYVKAEEEIITLNDDVVDDATEKPIKKRGRKKIVRVDENKDGDQSSVPQEPVEAEQEYGCPICNGKFISERSRSNHLSSAHYSAKHGIQCLETGCNFSCGFTFLLQNHLAEVHNIPMKFLNYEFDTVADFEAWKCAYEKQESCRFVKKSGCKLKTGGQVSGYMYCSRTGKFVSHATGKKKMRKIGSSKISGYCTASVKYYEDADSGKIKAVVCSTHYGHQKDYRYLRITGNDRKAIVDKIKSGVPRDVILDTVRSGCGVMRPDRLHLISVKDLDNIERANKIASKPSGDGRRKLSTKFTDEWVKGLSQANEDNSVLYYKRRNYSDEYLEDQDECIILMTAGQSEICSRLANGNPVCILYATILMLPHLHNFYLTSLLMVDEFSSTFPIAFMICSRRDTPAMKLFFSKLKEKQGPIKLKAFATDNLEYIFKTWCSVFQEEQSDDDDDDNKADDSGDKISHIWANRYVDEEWRDYLSVIEDEELQMNVYDEIYRFIESADDSYKTRLPDVIRGIIDNPECAEFGKYLSQYFLDNVRLWATCYLKDVTGGMTEPIDFDTTYNRIRDTFEYGNIRLLKHMGKSAQQLIKLMISFHVERDKRFTTLTELIGQTHDMKPGDMLNVFPFQKGTWKIAAPGTSTDVTTNPETVIESNCVYGDLCALRCDKCDVCIHRLKCSCEYYTLNRVCKHVHLLASSLLKLRKTLPSIATYLSNNDNNSSNNNNNNNAIVNNNGEINDVVNTSNDSSSNNKQTIVVEEQSSSSIDDKSVNNIVTAESEDSIVKENGGSTTFSTSVAAANTAQDNDDSNKQRRLTVRLQKRRTSLRCRSSFMRAAKTNIRDKLNYMRKTSFALKKPSSYVRMQDCVGACFANVKHILRLDRRCKGFTHAAYEASKKRFDYLKELEVYLSFKNRYYLNFGVDENSKIASVALKTYAKCNKMPSTTTLVAVKSPLPINYNNNNSNSNKCDDTTITAPNDLILLRAMSAVVNEDKS